MSLASRFGMVCFLLILSQEGIAGLIQDPARIRLLGFCSQLDKTALSFDEKGNLNIDLSSLPPLTPELRKIVCQVKTPYTAGTKVIAGSWQLEADYHVAQGSRMLSTLRFSNVGKVGEARIWSIEEPASSPLTWNETWSVASDNEQEAELKITWTNELQLSKDGKEPASDSPPSFQLKRVTLGAEARASIE